LTEKNSHFRDVLIGQSLNVITEETKSNTITHIMAPTDRKIAYNKINTKPEDVF